MVHGRISDPVVV